MKTSVYSMGFVVATLFATLLSCETSTELNPTASQPSNPKTKNSQDNLLTNQEWVGNNSKENVLAAACEEYALVLAGNTGTPHMGGLQSFLMNVNIATGMTTAASSITNGSISTLPIIESMTGITKLQGNALYGVTGVNSNFPNRLFVINAATGVANPVGPTVVGSTTTSISLQDIERYPQTGVFYAIKEGTNQIWRSTNALNWTLLATAPTPTGLPLNALCFRNNRLWVLSGPANTLCGTNYGNMYQYNLAGVLMGVSSYNASVAQITWINKECGMTFYNPGGCVAKNFAVGSAMGILSNNMTLCPAVPTLISQIKPTYDFAKP
jgi:hypothetical protein